MVKVCFSALLAVLAGVAMVQGDHGYPDFSHGHNGYPAAGHNGEFPGFLPAPLVTKDEPEELTRVDKLFQRMAAINKFLPMATEEMNSLRSRLAVVNKLALHLQLEEDKLDDEESEMASKLTILSNINSEIVSKINDVNSLTGSTQTVISQTDKSLKSAGEDLVDINVDLTEKESQALYFEEYISLSRDTYIDFVDASAQCIEDRMETMEKRRLANLKSTILSQKCESGTLTIHRDDHRATALFQTDFGDEVPNVLWGIAGYTFDLKTRGVPNPSPYYGNHGGYGYGYGYGYGHSHSGSSYAEPNALGVFIQATPSNDGVTFQTINYGFGDSDLITVKVNYQACNFRSEYNGGPTLS